MKYGSAVIILLILLAACVSSPIVARLDEASVSAVPAVAGLVSLDEAIDAAAREIEERVAA